MRRLVIGDIHGCHAELLALLDVAGIGPDDEVVAIGDIVDRGPDPPRVLDFFRSRPRARSIQGNHERKHVRSARGELRPALSQVLARRQIGEAAYPAACAFMEGLPLSLDLPEALLVHGFFEPGVPLAEQRDTVLVGTMSGEDHLRAAVRGPWYEAYDGPKPLIVGHRDYLRSGAPLVWRDRVFGIDTGCYCGGRLTGIILPEMRIVSVPAARDYWAEARRAYALEARAVTSADALRPAALEALARIHAHAHREAARLLEALARERPLDSLTHAEVAKRFSTLMGRGQRLSAELHLARKGRLTLDELRRRLGDPAAVLRLAHALGLGEGLPDPTPPASEPVADGEAEEAG